METNCINVCKYEDDICKGCFRTIEQISTWTKMSSRERKNAIKEANKRKGEYFGTDYYGNPI